jgi:hypothetical protein
MMKTMRALLVMVAFPAVAHAQAPGEVAPARPSVMENRWAVSVALAGESLTAKTDDAKPVGFGGLELAGRYRIRPTIEVSLAFSAAGNQGIGTVGFYLEGRYRFLPERPWSPFAGLSLGVASVGDKTGNETERKGRGALRLSGGIERRIGNFGIDATLRLVGIAENKDVMTVVTAGQRLSRYGVSGGELAIGASYYF